MRQTAVGGPGFRLVSPDVGVVVKPARRLLGRCSDGAGSGDDRDSLHDSWDRADGSNDHSYRGLDVGWS